MEQELKFSFINDHMIIDGCDTLKLAKQYGTPVYLMSKSIIDLNCQMFLEILKKEYPNSILSYASKAFCCKEMYRIIKNYGFSCDVVSGGELATALSANFGREKIFFHGNNKTISEIEYAIKNNVLNFIVDNDTEIENLLNCAKKIKNFHKKINIIVRVNPGIEAHTHEFVQTAKTDSKFGIDINNIETEKFILKIKEHDEFNFLGLHCHIGSQIFDKEPFVIATKKLCDFLIKLKQKYNIDVGLLNIGGGFGSWYTKKDKNLKKSDYKAFISAIAKELKNTVTRNNLIQPTLVIEPGRSIVAEAGFTLYTVGNIKEIKGIRKYVAIDGGMFENPRYIMYGAEYTAIKCEHTSTQQEKVTIVGKCCESGDCITKDAKVEKLNVGDIIAILSTGAYNYSMASNYNRNPIPPVVLLDKGKSKVIVKGQTYKDLIKYDR